MGDEKDQPVVEPAPEPSEPAKEAEAPKAEPEGKEDSSA